MSTASCILCNHSLYESLLLHAKMSHYKVHAPHPLHAVNVADLSPWKVIDRIWTATSGSSLDSMNIVPGQTPLLTLKSTMSLLVTYYIVIFTGREFMRNRAPFKLNDLFLIHNLYLTCISGALLVLFLEQLIPTLWKQGMFYSICADENWTQPLEALYYVSFFAIDSTQLRDSYG